MKNIFKYLCALIIVILFVTNNSTISNAYNKSSKNKQFEVVSIKNIEVTVTIGDNFILPRKVKALLSNKQYTSLDIRWNVKDINTSIAGVQNFYGMVQGYPNKVKLKLLIKEVPITIKSIDDINAMADQNSDYVLPLKINGLMSNGKIAEFPVVWNGNVETSKIGTYTYLGKVSGYESDIKANITIKPMIVSVMDSYQIVTVGDKYNYPTIVKATMSDSTVRDVNITFNYSPIKTDVSARYSNIIGKINGYNKDVLLNVFVRKYNDLKLNFITDKKEFKNIFTDILINSPVSVDYEPLDSNQVNRVTDIYDKEIAKYPKELLMYNINGISFFKKLKIYGNYVGGTFDDSNIYVADDNYKDNDLKMEFNHELNHILFFHYKGLFDEKNWNDANPKGFKYGSGGTAAISQGRSSTKLDANLAKNGFINEYAQSAIDEDIAEISQYLFINDNEFWNLVDNNEALRKKVNIIIDFYNKLNPVFSEEYFRSIKN